MSQSQKLLFRNVYSLVNRETGEPTETNRLNLDLGAKDNMMIKSNIERVSILDQYQMKYNQTTKAKPYNSQYLKSRARLEQNHTMPLQQNNEASHADELMDKFGLSTPDIKKRQNQDLEVKKTNTGTSGFNSFGGTSLSRERISLADLKAAEVMSKIKKRTMITNPGVFEDQSQRCSSQKNLVSRQRGSNQMVRTLDSVKVTQQPTRKTLFSQQSAGGQHPMQLKQTNYSLVQNPSMEPRSDLNLLSSQEDLERQNISAYLAAYERRLFDNAKFGREDLKVFLQQKYQLPITELTAIEGISYCRGKQMEKSTYYNRDKLIEWLSIQIPILQTQYQIQEQTAEVQQQIRQQKKLQTLRNEDRDATGCHTERAKHVEMENILDHAKLNTKQRAKLVNSLVDIDEEVQLQKSNQGLLGQMAAQQRLVQTARERQRVRKVEVQRQISDTCQFETAVRALQLQTHMNPTWSEKPNSYQICSQMSERQRRRLREMMDRRLEFPKY